MKTKIRLTVMMILAVGVLQLSAQQGEHQPPSIKERVEKVTEHLEKEMELSSSQIKVVQGAYTNFFKTADKLMQSGERPSKEVMEKHEKVRDNKIKEVLSKEKYEKYHKISCTLKPKHNKNGERPPK